MTMSNLGIYVHIPFCESKCAYCDFASFVTREEVKEKYFASLFSEIESSPFRGREVDTIYIGGGTPSCVKKEFIEKILNATKASFKVAENAEISMECNPNSGTLEKLKFYKALGINRLSFGVQSLDDKALKEIGRLHNSEIALNAIKDAKEVGFENINADLLIGLSKASEERLLSDAQKLLESGVSHISAYMLQVEEGTAIFDRVKNNPEYLPSEDESVVLYEALVAFLEKQGFARYEISNFAKAGYECKHNYKYWSGEDYLGFGLGAHSLLDGERFANSKIFDEYFVRKVARETLTRETRILERIMLGIRCNLGFSKSQLFSLGYDITQNSSYAEFLERGILQESGDIVRLNPAYYGVSNYIITCLM